MVDYISIILITKNLNKNKRRTRETSTSIVNALGDTRVVNG